MSPHSAPPAGLLDLSVRAAAAAPTSLDPDTLQAIALFELIWGDGAGNSLEQSISLLQRAALLAEDPTPVLANLSAALLERAYHNGNPHDLFEAVEVAERAITLKPSASALFNLALALERLGLVVEAKHAWRRYTMFDSSSSWTREAERRIDALAQLPASAPPPGPGTSGADVSAFARQSPQEARLYVWDQVLGHWGAAVVAGRHETAERHLRLAEMIGETLVRQGGDGTVADAVAAIRAAAGDNTATLHLARAHLAYSAGQAAYAGADDSTAAQRFTEAGAEGTASPSLSQWAALFQGASLHYLDDPAGARTVRQVLARSDPARHPALRARAQWMLGTILLRDGRFEEARSAYAAAATLFGRIGEREHQGAMHGSLAETEFALGDDAAAYTSLHRGLALLRPFPGSAWRHNLLYVAAQSAIADRLPLAAARIQEEGMYVADRLGRPEYLAEARFARARVHAAGGDRRGAAADIAAGSRLLEHVESAPARAWLQENLRLARASVSLPVRPDLAAAALDSALIAPTVRDVPLRRLQGLVLRSRARLALRQIDGAVADLDSTTVLLAGLNSEIGNTAQHVTVLGAAREQVDRLVMLHVNAGREDQALIAVERARTSLVPGATQRFLQRSRLPRVRRGHVVLDYTIIDDTLLIWTVTEDAIHLTRATVRGEDLRRTAERARASLESRSDEDVIRRDLEALYDWLVRPVVGQLCPGRDTLVLILDEEIGGVPFAALHDRQRGRYLLQDHLLHFAGSLRNATSTGKDPAHKPRSVLLVADPAFDERAHPGLARLPGARAEGQAVRRIYPAAKLLAGEAADREAVLQALPAAEIVHYAGHAVFDDERPERSFLVLAPPRGGKGSGRLTAADLRTLRLDGVRLVVLSACQTLRSRDGRSGGFQGLAGALLEAGADGVVGSLWRVDDALTQALATRLHDAYAASGNAAVALRTAQLRMLGSRSAVIRSPAAWAGFRYTGS